MRNVPRLSSPAGGRQGLTILEVMLAVVILTLVSVTLLQFLVSGDRIRGRGLLIERATLCARNEAERIKTATGTDLLLQDSVYSVSTGGRKFTVERQVLDEPEEAPKKLLEEWEHCQLIEIRVSVEGEDATLVSCRLLQGYVP